MSHEEAFSDLAAVALDAVNADVAHAVRSHAAACPECGPELAAMEEAVARLGELVPSAQMNRGRGAGIRSRLLMRARIERESQSAPVPGPPDLSRGVASLTGLGARGTPGAQKAVTGEARRVTPAYPQHQTVQAGQVGRRMNWLAMAAGLALVATGAQLVRVTADRNSIREQLAAADTVTPVNDSLALALNQKDAMIAITIFSHRKSDGVGIHSSSETTATAKKSTASAKRATRTAATGARKTATKATKATKTATPKVGD